MAKGVNKAFLLGHVGKDPEIRSTTGGTLVAASSLATADCQKDQQGNWQDKTEWHNIIAFGRTAEIVRDYVKKGTKLLIEGKIQTRSWDDKESGLRKYRTEIIVTELTLLGGRPDESGRSSSHSDGHSRGYGQHRTVAHDDYADQGITDEDIPF